MNLWIDDKRGFLMDWITQKWVILTGRKIDPGSTPWLAAPMGKPKGIGEGFYEEFANENNLIIDKNARAGLVKDISILDSPSFKSKRIHKDVIDFYKNTTAYTMDVWSEWCSAFRPFGWLIAYLFSRRLQQLNVPLSGLDSMKGVDSNIVLLKDRKTKKILYTAWIRKLLTTKNVLYAGNYTTAFLPSMGSNCLKVAFPLPNGNAIVVMKPEALPDGSFLIRSAGKKFGDPGFYFTLRNAKGKFYARYVQSFQESLHVYPAEEKTVRADHILNLWGLKVLHIHYRLTKKNRN